MAFTELELKRIDKAVGELCRRMSPPQIADKLRVVYDVEGQSVSIWEERPHWRRPGEWTRSGIARFRYVRSSGTWTLYWRRADGKWHLFEPVARRRT